MEADSGGFIPLVARQRQRSDSNAQRRTNGVSCRVIGMPGKDAEKILRLCRGFQVEVVSADNALGIARLQGGFAHLPEFSHEHRNERVPHHVVRQAERVEDLSPDFLGIVGKNGKAIQRIGAQPGREIGLDGDDALHADLRYLGLDVNDAGVEADMPGLESRDFPGENAGTNASEQAERKIRCELALPERLDVSHELAGLLGGDRRG